MKKKTSHITETIFLLNIIAFIIEIIVPSTIDYFGLNPQTIISTPWTIITAMFLHSGILHIFQNMIALVIFGLILERIIGSPQFIKIYLIAGIAGNIAGIIFYPHSISLGASGAIMGILGALVVLRPKMIIYFGAPMPLILLTIMWMSIDLIGFFVPIDNTGHAAHLAGFAAGMLWSSYNRNKYSEEKELKKEIEKELSDTEFEAWEKKYM